MSILPRPQVAFELVEADHELQHAEMAVKRAVETRDELKKKTESLKQEISVPIPHGQTRTFIVEIPAGQRAVVVRKARDDFDGAIVDVEILPVEEV